MRILVTNAARFIGIRTGKALPDHGSDARPIALRALRQTMATTTEFRDGLR